MTVTVNGSPVYRSQYLQPVYDSLVSIIKTHSLLGFNTSKIVTHVRIRQQLKDKGSYTVVLSHDTEEPVTLQVLDN